MKNTLEKLLHSPVNIRRKKGKTALPLYLTAGREIFDVQFSGSAFCAVKLRSTENVDVRKLKHQLLSYAEAFGNPIAFCIPDLTGRKRETLIKAGIPFIAPPGQLYLPFLGVVLQDKYPKKADMAVKDMSPLEQMLLLRLLYSKKEMTKSSKDMLKAISAPEKMAG